MFKQYLPQTDTLHSFLFVPPENGYLWSQDHGCNQIKMWVICVHVSGYDWFPHEKERCGCSDMHAGGMPRKHEAATHKALLEAWNWAFPWPGGSYLVNTSIPAFSFQINAVTCCHYLSPHPSPPPFRYFSQQLWETSACQISTSIFLARSIPWTTSS